MRAFLAIDIPVEENPRLAAVADDLRAVRGVKAVAADLLHITLHFFGDIDEDDVERIDLAIGAHARKQNAFTLRFADVGAFPSTARPQVIWAGCAADELGPFVLRVREALTAAGHRSDRRFEPHLTLGRVKSPPDQRALTRFFETHLGETMGEVQVRDIRLKRSELRPDGPVYANLRVWSLNGHIEDPLQGA